MNKKRSLLPLLVIAALFFTPMLLAQYLFFFHQPSHLHTTNHGQLISPMLNIKTLVAPSEQWRLVYLTEKPCHKQCEQQVGLMQHIQLALGKHQDKVKPTLLSPHQTQQAFANVDSIALTAVQLSQLEKQLTEAYATDNFYILDPHGNLMMFYPENTKPKAILKDLQRLVKA